MPASDWRSPSRVLEVTVRQACYPINEKVLHVVFNPFGVVEQVHVLDGLDHVLAHVVFHSKNYATDAFRKLHGPVFVYRLLSARHKVGVIPGV